MQRKVLTMTMALGLLLPLGLARPSEVFAETGRCDIGGASDGKTGVAVIIAKDDPLQRAYGYKLLSPCSGVDVTASYNARTGQAKEFVHPSGSFGPGSAIGEWICEEDPWFTPVEQLSKYCKEVSQEITPPMKFADFGLSGDGSTAVPLSAIALSSSAHQKLKTLYQTEANKLPASTSGSASGAPKPAGAPAVPVGAPAGGMASFSTGDPLENPSYGDNIMALQYLLKARGYGAIDLNGEFEDETEGFVKDFQGKNQLPANGIVGPETWGKLWTPLKRGAQGDTVKAAQTLLAWHTLDVDVNGAFGPETEDAVKVFQEDKGVPVTGEIDVRTWAALVNGD